MAKAGRERRVCHYCGAAGTTRDHIVPRARGGTGWPWNLVDACVPCNSRKGMALPICPCPHCVRALARWRANESASEGEIARRELAQRKRWHVEIPPELACLSPAMRDYLMSRRPKES